MNTSGSDLMTMHSYPSVGRFLFSNPSVTAIYTVFDRDLSTPNVGSKFIILKACNFLALVSTLKYSSSISIAIPSGMVRSVHNYRY